MKVASLQVSPQTANHWPAVLRQSLEWCSEQNVNLLLTPELFLTGYYDLDGIPQSRAKSPPWSCSHPRSFSLQQLEGSTLEAIFSAAGSRSTSPPVVTSTETAAGSRLSSGVGAVDPLTYGDPILSAISKLTAQYKVALVVGGAERWNVQGSNDSGKATKTIIYNTTLLFDPNGAIRCASRKSHLWGRFEKAVFTPNCTPVEEPSSSGGGSTTMLGSHQPIVDLFGFKIGLMCCFDVEFPEFVRNFRLRGANFIVAPSAAGDDLVHRFMIRIRALENECFVAYPNLIGEAPLWTRPFPQPASPLDGRRSAGANQSPAPAPSPAPLTASSSSPYGSIRERTHSTKDLKGPKASTTNTTSSGAIIPEDRELSEDIPTELFKGGSCIVGPDGSDVLRLPFIFNGYCCVPKYEPVWPSDAALAALEARRQFPDRDDSDDELPPPESVIPDISLNGTIPWKRLLRHTPDVASRVLPMNSKRNDSASRESSGGSPLGQPNTGKPKATGPSVQGSNTNAKGKSNRDDQAEALLVGFSLRGVTLGRPKERTTATNATSSGPSQNTISVGFSYATQHLADRLSRNVFLSSRRPELYTEILQPPLM